VWYGGATVVASRTPIRTPRDFAGKSLAVRSAATEREFRAIGATASRVPDRDMTLAMNRGGVDAAELQWSEIAALDLARVYVAPTNHRVNGYVVIFNQARWSAISSANQRRIEDAMRDVGRELSSQVLRRERDAEQQAVRSGRVIEVAVPEATRREWHGSLASVQTRDISRIGPQLVDEARIRTSARAASNAAGGPAYLWNAWFESDPANVVSALDQRRYRFTLDLGRGEYPGALHGMVGRLVRAEIERVPEAAEIRLLVRPVLLGDVLKVAEGSQLTAKTLVIKRDRLAPHPRAAELQAQLQRFRSMISPPSLASQASPCRGNCPRTAPDAERSRSRSGTTQAGVPSIT
jgi:hypothetical protein